MINNSSMSGGSIICVSVQVCNGGVPWLPTLPDEFVYLF